MLKPEHFDTEHVLWLPSPAKINLFLHICGRLENGYHSLQSVFQMLDYGDEIGFRLLPEAGAIILKDNIKGVAEKDNLIYKAAVALTPFRKIDAGIEISVRKLLPMGGGIGGGSSNAATVLLALNIAWDCGLATDELATLALTLGADVPVFVHGDTAFADGIGEKLSPIAIPTKYYLVATPNVHVSTAEVFSHPALKRDTPRITKADYSFESTHNDCQTLVAKMHSPVASLLKWLLHYGPSRMTGTGASVFAVFDAQIDAQKVLEKLPSEFTGFVAKGLSKSPLHTCLQKI